MKRLLFFLLAIIFAIQVFAQNVQIGSGTSTQRNIPLRAYYGYSYSQQIIKSSEISTSGAVTSGGTISKIYYYWDGSGDFVNSTQWKVYLGHTTKTLFASSTDWAPVSGLSLVFDSLITPPTSSGWFAITLQTPFVYNGTDNLILAVDENMPNYSGGNAYFLSYSSTNCGLYYFDDEINPNPSSPPSGTRTSSVPQVKLYFSEACASPQNLSITSLNFSDVTIDWTNGGTETQWNIRYKLLTDTTWTYINSVTTKPYQIIGITPNSNYEVQVQSDCGLSTLSLWTPSRNFTTTAIPTQLPFTTDFENSIDNSNWQFINGNQVNKWFVGNAIDPTTGLSVDTLGVTGSLYISRNALGDTNIYSGGSSANVSKVYAFRDFFIPTGATEVNLEFDWRANGNAATSDFMRVYLVPTTATITAGSIPPSGLDASAQIGNYTGGLGEHWLSKQINWKHAKFRITDTQFPLLANNTWRLLILWRNESTTGTMQPPAAVDNLSMNVITCPTPISFTASNPTVNSVDLSWVETGSATAWNVYYKETSSSAWAFVPAYSNPFTLTNLNSGASYQVKVQSNCGLDTSYNTPIVNFITACGAITAFPWNEGFEATWYPAGYMGNSISPICWTNVNKGASNSWERNTSTVHSGVGAATIYTDFLTTPSNDWLITPVITLTGNQRLRFWAMNYDATSNEVDEISIWVNNNPTFDTTGMGINDSIPGFVKVMQTEIQVGTWAQYEVNLSQFTGDSYIAFVRKYNPNDGWNLRLDDVEVSDLPTCTGPDTLTVSNILGTSVDISWIDSNTSNTLWNLYYKKSTDINYMSVPVTTSPYTLTPIDPSTIYQVYMTTVCGGVESEATPINTFKTLCVPIDASTVLPWSEGFEGISSTNELPNCWAATNLGSKIYTQIANLGSYNRNAHSGTKSAYFLFSCNDYLYTPGFNLLAGTTYTFSYWYVTDGLSGWTSLGAGVYSAQNASSFIQNVGTPILNANNTTYQQYVGTFTPTSTGVYYFGVQCQATINPLYLTLDDFRLEVLNCTTPTTLVASNATINSADLSWTETGSATAWNIYYKEASSSTWTLASASSNPFTLTNLNPGMVYQVKVQSNCGVDTSYCTSIVSFNTPCYNGAITTYPWIEGFENGVGCWTQSYVVGAQNWNSATTVNGGSAHSGTNFASFYSGSSSNAKTKLISPVLDLTTLVSPKLSFWHIQPSWLGAQNTIKVYYRISDTSTWVQIFNFSGDISVWTKDSIILPNPSSKYQIAFEGYDNYGLNAGIDDFVIEDDNSVQCSAPALLSASAITNTSATITWTVGGSEIGWQVRQGATGTPVDVVSSTYQAIGLTKGTAYTYYVRANCGTSYSAWVSVLFTTTSLPVLTTVTTLNPSSITYNSAIFNGSYLQGDDTVNAVGFRYKVSTANIWTLQAVSPLSTPFSYTFTGLIPNTTYQLMAYSTTNLGTNIYGDTVTFTTPALLPPTVATTSITNVTSNSATFNGTTAQGTESILSRGFEYKTSSQTWTSALDVIGMGSTTISANVTGLVNGTTYNVRAYAETSSGKTYGSEISFIAGSLVILGEVSTLGTTNIATTSATLNGTVVNVGGASIGIEVGFVYSTITNPEINGANVIKIPVTYTTGMTNYNANISGLTDTTQYYVKSYITNSAGTAYGQEMTFITRKSGLIDIDANSMSVQLYPNPATTVATLVIKGISGKARIMISDVQGRTINTFEVKSVNGEAIKSINVNNFAKGVYYVRIQNENTISTQKLIIR